MPVRHVIDGLGHTLRLYVHEKKPWHLSASVFNSDMCENMPSYPLRDDDILICSYPKSGCHWVWEISRMLLKGDTTLDDVNKESAMMEFSNVERQKNDLDSLPSPRILNNHQHFDNQPQDLVKKKTKVIFIYRNPRDVAVSFYYHTKRLPFYQFTGPDFASYLPRFVDGLVDHGSVFDYMKGWENGIKNQELNACVLCYEDLKTSGLSLSSLRKLSTFLGQSHDDAFLEEVIKATDISNMRSAKTQSFKDAGGSIHYRKGQIGDWKNHFTVAQSEWFDHVTRTRMADSEMFHFRYDV